MPAVVRKRGNRWVVLSHDGPGAQVLGRHKTKRAAGRQQRAVNRQLRKKGRI